MRIPKDQRWFYHPEMQAQIARSEADFAAGRATWTKTPEEAQAFLDGLKRNAEPPANPEDVGAPIQKENSLLDRQTAASDGAPGPKE